MVKPAIDMGVIQFKASTEVIFCGPQNGFGKQERKDNFANRETH